MQHRITTLASDRGGLPEIPWTGALAAFTVLSAATSIIFILDDTKYPDPMPRAFAFEYLLRQQDIAGSIVIAALVIAAWMLRKRACAIDMVGILARNPWLTAASVFIMLCAAMLTVVHNHPLAGDEHLSIFQSRVFAAGRLAGQFPPDLVAHLIPTVYQGRWLVASTSGQVASIYWPGFALLLTPFSFLGIPWACNPLLASLSLVLIAKTASRLTADARAGGWAMLFALGSPGFLGLALSYFPMTAQLFLNLLFAWLLVERTPGRLVAAGIVGSLAIVQGNPVPHILFALPWVVWLARQPDRRRSLALLAAAYAPLTLLLGLGWWLFLRKLQGDMAALAYAADADPLHHLGNLLWYLALELRTVFTAPSDETLGWRIGEQVRLWGWAVPGLPILAAAGWWMRGRYVIGLHLLALSLASTLVGFLFVSFDQGYGWGARYVHSAWAVLPILASAAMVSVETGGKPATLVNYGVRVALFSLVFATALRLVQIRLFMDDQLALRPPFEPGAKQIVFITLNVDYYTMDFVQNDPFLRDPVIFMMSWGPVSNYKTIIERRYPRARLTYDGPNGQVWKLD